jgi:hypothetical protein
VLRLHSHRPRIKVLAELLLGLKMHNGERRLVGGRKVRRPAGIAAGPPTSNEQRINSVGDTLQRTGPRRPMVIGTAICATIGTIGFETARGGPRRCRAAFCQGPIHVGPGWRQSPPGKASLIGEWNARREELLGSKSP